MCLRERPEYNHEGAAVSPAVTVTCGEIPVCAPGAFFGVWAAYAIVIQGLSP